MLISPGAIGAVTEILSADDFYRESHGTVFRACLALYQQGEPVDAITIVDALEERGELEAVGGKAKIHELAALVPATANAAHYARIVREMATLRGLVRAGAEIARLGQDRPGDTDRSRRPGRADRLRPRAAARHRRLQPHRGAAQGELRADHAPLRGRRRRHGDPDGLPGAGQAHVGASSRAT